MKLNKSQAAKAVGISRTTLDTHLKNGKLSHEKNRRGQVVIDVTELERVYDTVNFDTASNDVQAGQDETPTNAKAYRNIVQVKNELIEHLKAELEQERKRTDAVQERLDQSERERREKDMKLTALLTDQRDRSGEVERLKAELEAEKGRGFWSRLTGR